MQPDINHRMKAKPLGFGFFLDTSPFEIGANFTICGGVTIGEAFISIHMKDCVVRMIHDIIRKR